MSDRGSFIEYVRYTLVGLFIILVVSSAVYVVYRLSLRGEGGPEIVKQEPPAQTRGGIQGELPSVPPAPETTAKERGLVQPPPSTLPEEKPLPPIRKYQNLYTVYIAAYTSNIPAAEEVSRWIDAGYIASVIKTKRHFLVALGHYETVPDARTFGEGMFEAFENGYWVGIIK